jgi:ABC-type glycerol-3-phosphate transport system substrate-binding protein
MALAITENSADKQAAWEFIRTILTEDWQREQQHMYGRQYLFPTNKRVFDEAAANAMLDPVDDLSVILGFTALSQSQLNQIFAMIDSITFVSGILPSTLDDIVTEGASDFFRGRTSAQDAARIIQSRASIFISEQSR